ncbi:YbjN domain-containing protein [Lentzea sp. NPDC051213]|uniref:YbjN domain-containing protein n=1 Tax=Lentzea sp. NPDC051213 TaxID=3364126 RepID=UPI0037A1A50F
MNATGDALEAARKALELFHDVSVDDDGALSFRHGDVPCAVQGMELADGLTVLSLTVVVAWDLVGDVSVWVAERAGQGLFGTLGVIPSERGTDVMLRYAFPADGLKPEPLSTLLMLVVSTASQVRGELLSRFS